MGRRQTLHGRPRSHQPRHRRRLRLRGRPGKLVSLWRLVLHHFGDLEADLAHHYPGEPPLADLLWGSDFVDLRRLLNLILHLPPASSTFILGIAPEIAERSQWDTVDELLATLIELTDLGIREERQRWAKKGTSPGRKPIVKITRPGDRRRRKPVPMSDPSARAFFGGAVEYTPPS